MTVEKVVIIIPTYNEEQVIVNTLTTVFASTASIPNMEINILVFDSNSTDNTYELVRDLQQNNPRLHLLKENQKSGLGSAYLQAMRHALSVLAADIIMEFDADLSHQPQYIEPMLAKMQTHDVVIGSRYVSGGEIPTNWGWKRKLLSVVGNYVARFVLTFKYKDLTSGFRATRRAFLAKVLPDKFLSNNYAYKIELLWLLHKNKARICEYPIVFVDRQQGYSKLPTNSIFDSLRVLFLLRLRQLKPYLNMCLVGFVGMILQCAVYNLLRHKLPPFNAAQFAVLVAMMNNFTLNSRFTFKKAVKSIGKSRAKKIKAFVLFLICSVFMLYLQSYWLKLGIEFLGAGYLKENLIIISGIIIGSIISYLFYSKIIWQRPK